VIADDTDDARQAAAEHRREPGRPVDRAVEAPSRRVAAEWRDGRVPRLREALSGDVVSSGSPGEQVTSASNLLGQQLYVRSI
jgi:hypothetical protein